MAQMAGGIAKNLEKVGEFTPTEYVQSHTFNYDGKRAAYILITEPFGTVNEMLNNPNVPSAGQLVVTWFLIIGAIGSPAVKITGTTTLRASISNYVDNWSPGLTVTDSEISIEPISGRVGFYPGYKYVLYRFII